MDKPQPTDDAQGLANAGVGSSLEPTHQAERLMLQLNNQGRRLDVPKPNRQQVAMILHALADHTAIMLALKHRPDPTSPWPEATSIGRWFHDIGDVLEDATEIRNG